MKAFVKLLIVSVLGLISVNSYAALFGSGTDENPYLIADINDFLEFSAVSNAATYWTAGVHTKLMAEIDLDPALSNRLTYTSAVIAPDDNSSSGFQGASYNGVFDGNNFAIINMTIHTNTVGNGYLGLFGQVSGATAMIKNLEVEDCIISGGGASDNIGGLCGENYNGTISNCYATGSVAGDDNIGGLCGYNNGGTLSNCYAIDSVSGYYAIGGLCGYNNAYIDDCYASGSVTGGTSSHNLGGLCGYNDYGSIVYCYATGNIIAGTSSYNLGGLCGYNYGTLSNCHATGGVTGGDNLGGLCGYNYGTTEDCYATGDVLGDDSLGGLCGYAQYVSIKRCYATGTVTGNDNIGGLCGYHTGSTSSTIEDCYSTGDVSGGATADQVGGLCGANGGYWIKNCYSTGSVTGAPGSTLVGGLCGFNNTRIVGCFWDMDASGLSTSDGGKGLTTAQMKQTDFYSASGWDTASWLLDVGNDSPHLPFENLPGVALPAPISSLPGSGTDADPWLINTVADFLEICQGSFYWDKHYVLNADLDLSGVQFCNAPLGYDYSFTGVFDGNGHLISNLAIDTEGLGTDNLGLFGHISQASAMVMNLGVENCVITGGTGSDSVGALFGRNGDDGPYYGPGGTISNCYATATVSGDNYVGGLCGRNSKADIKDSYAIASVSGTSRVGGLCGWNRIYGLLSDCHATGTVSGTGYIGGLCGYNETGYIDDCYATADVSGGASSYYIGGLCGKNRDRWIKNSYASGSVTGGNSSHGIGSLCGENYDAAITNCSASGNVIAGTSSYQLGGLCGNNSGYNSVGTIEDCSASGSVTGGDSSYQLGGLCGALAGWNGSVIKRCYATGHVTGGNNSYQLGGICGNSDSSYNGSLIENCYATGNIMGGESANQLGGICGYNGADDYLGRHNTIENCYSTGSITGESGATLLGGICGRNSGLIAGSFWDMDTSGLSTSDGGKGLTTAQMKQPNFYSANGWTDTPWILDAGNNYPHLPSEGITGLPIAAPSSSLLGSGTKSDPWQINTTSDFLEICQGSFYWDKYYILNTDIDLNGIDFCNAPIGYNIEFSGVFDGNGHVVSNLLIDTEGLNTSNLGLFGTLQGEHSAVRNLGVENGSITGGTSDNLGGLCGYNDGVTIVNCHATGSITGNGNLGGLCGHNDAGSIEDCYAAVSVTGDSSASNLGGLCGYNEDGSIVYSYASGNTEGGSASYNIGGLCGKNSGTIPNGYASGSVSGNNYLGGLCGENSGAISNCYAMGSVWGINNFGGLCADNSGTISNCFWDTETSGVIISSGGTAKTTSEMQAEATFTNATWDLQNIWVMAGYPELKSFSTQSGGFSFWLANQGVPINLRSEESCPMGDGIANLLKYACGLPAMQVSSASDYMSVLVDNNSATFSMRYYKSATATHVLLQPIWVSDLNEAWSPDDITVIFIQNEGDKKLMQASIPINDSGFMRLLATTD